jgi:hemerythrin-like domain-containing protein
MILEQLDMIEATIGPRSARRGVLTKTNRNTLRELLRFFTRRVGIHFKREATLIAELRRILGRKPEERNQFQSLLDEHRMLKADASAVMKKLTAQEKETSSHSLLPERNNGHRTLAADLRTFIRRYRGHISCEERILFVLADMRLTAEQKQRISHRMLQV